MRAVLCTGSRGWTSDVAIYTALESIRLPFLVIVGDARGADAMFWQCAQILDLPRVMFKADWDRYGNAAGPIRNKVMLRFLLRQGGNICLAAWDGKSRGTKGMMDLAREKNVDVWRIS